MRFNILITSFLLFALASGLVVPPKSRRGTDLYTRQLLVQDANEVDVRSPSLFSLAGSLLKSVPKVLGAAKNVVKGVAKGAKSVGNAAKGVASKAKGVASKAGGAVSKTGKNVASKAKGAASKTKGAVSKAGKSVATKAKGAATKAKGAASKAKEKVNDKVNGPKAKYNVPAGGGKPAQSYSRKDVKKAAGDANAEHQRHKSGTMSNRQKKNSPLKDFGNNNHHVPKKGSPGPNSLPKVKGPGLKEYPLRRPSQIAANPKEKGPARVIMKENKGGQLKFKGVVAHDQGRAHGTPGANDHFQIKGSRK